MIDIHDDYAIHVFQVLSALARIWYNADLDDNVKMKELAATTAMDFIVSVDKMTVDE